MTLEVPSLEIMYSVRYESAQTSMLSFSMREFQSSWLMISTERSK